MSKKFYLVKNEVNPSTGGFIPYKVFNYSPSILQPMPIPINTSTGLSLPLESPSFIGSNYGYPYYNAPQVSLTGKPIPPQFMSAYNPMTYAPTLGAPIIKYSPILQQRVPGIIKIVVGSNIIMINVPYMYFRQVINDIYYKAFNNLNETDAKIPVQISGPGIDTTIKTTSSKILEIVKYIENKYDGISYNYNGLDYRYPDFYRNLIF
jgi:hypothetical protein